jgi:hypothetical protein
LRLKGIDHPMEDHLELACFEEGFSAVWWFLNWNSMLIHYVLDQLLNWDVSPLNKLSP